LALKPSFRNSLRSMVILSNPHRIGASLVQF